LKKQTTFTVHLYYAYDGNIVQNNKASISSTLVLPRFIFPHTAVH